MLNSGYVIWITGLSGAGKSTLADALLPHLGLKAILLDGDELRVALGVTDSCYDRESRLKLAMSYARLAKMLADQGFIIVVATISLFHEVHAWNKYNINNYLEVFLDVPYEVRKERDPKGLYAKQEQGIIKDMAGVETQVDFPIEPHLVFTHNDSTADEILAILGKLPCV